MTTPTLEDRVIEYLNDCDFVKVYNVPARREVFAVNIPESLDLDDPDDASIDKLEEIYRDGDNEDAPVTYFIGDKEFPDLKAVVEWVKQQLAERKDESADQDRRV